MSYCKTIDSVISEVKTWLCWLACNESIKMHSKLLFHMAFGTSRVFLFFLFFCIDRPIKVFLPLEDFWICYN